jgi:hypothetical protein
MLRPDPQAKTDNRDERQQPSEKHRHSNRSRHLSSSSVGDHFPARLDASSHSGRQTMRPAFEPRQERTFQTDPLPAFGFALAPLATGS